MIVIILTESLSKDNYHFTGLISNRLQTSPAINHNTWLLNPNQPQTTSTRSLTCLTSVPPSPSPPTPSPLTLTPSPPSPCPGYSPV